MANAKANTEILAAPECRHLRDYQGVVLAAKELGEAQFHVLLGEDPLGFAGLEQIRQVGIAGQHELCRFHEQLRRRLADVQGDQFQLGELVEIEVNVHLVNPSFGGWECQPNYGNQAH